MQELWREHEATPPGIEAALRRMIWRREGADGDSGPLLAPARVLNLVAIVGADKRDEIEDRLGRVGHLHPSRLVVCAVERGRPRISARGGVGVADARHAPGRVAAAYEQVELTVGPEHLSALDTIVDLLLVPDLPTMVWSPHGYDEGVDALRRLAQIVLIDSHDDSDAGAALARAADVAQDAYVVDLAWLRSTPWRERVAALFDPLDMRADLDGIAGVTARHRADSRATALLFCGWLCSRLGWTPSRLDDTHRGHADAGPHKVQIRLEAVEMAPPGLDGVTIELRSGARVALDRAPGGLRTTRHGPQGAQRAGMLFGASRGEAGILGEGVRQALLRDATYRPALLSALTFRPASR